MGEFDADERRLLRKLNTPSKIQTFLDDAVRTNFELNEHTLKSPRRVMRERTAFCFEGALFAAAALQFNGERPMILAMYAAKPDVDHAVALFKRGRYWGSITRTNHAVLRYREPVYRDPRELVISHFHEYFMNSGRKTLRAFTPPLDLRIFEKRGWRTDEENLWYIDEHLDRMKRVPILNRAQIAQLRRAHPIEIAAGKLTIERDPRKRR